MASGFNVEHVRKAPAGHKIRTALAGRHRVRIAFPPGAKQKGSGQVIEILHPKGENPKCAVTQAHAEKIAGKFPPELACGGERTANRKRSRNRRKNSPELLIFNPPRRKSKTRPGAGRRRRKLNPDQQAEAEELYTMFHGEKPEEILEVQESAAMRQTYSGLGDLLQLVVERASDQKQIELLFEGDDVIVASSPDGKQLYFIGGNQNLNGSLEQFDADTSKDFMDLGECVEIAYHTRKYFDGFQPIDYFHKLGEETGEIPRLFYNKIQKRMMLVGGAYKVELENLVEGMSPGIVN